MILDLNIVDFGSQLGLSESRKSLSIIRNSIIFQLLGGIRAGLGYTGSVDITDLHNKANFVQITASGVKESHVHDVQIIKEAPNYQIE